MSVAATIFDILFSSQALAIAVFSILIAKKIMRDREGTMTQFKLNPETTIREFRIHMYSYVGFALGLSLMNVGGYYLGNETVLMIGSVITFISLTFGVYIYWKWGERL